MIGKSVDGQGGEDESDIDRVGRDMEERRLEMADGVKGALHCLVLPLSLGLAVIPKVFAASVSLLAHSDPIALKIMLRLLSIPEKSIAIMSKSEGSYKSVSGPGLS